MPVDPGSERGRQDHIAAIDRGHLPTVGGWPLLARRDLRVARAPGTGAAHRLCSPDYADSGSTHGRAARTPGSLSTPRPVPAGPHLGRLRCCGSLHGAGRCGRTQPAADGRAVGRRAAGRLHRRGAGAGGGAPRTRRAPRRISMLATSGRWRRSSGAWWRSVIGPSWWRHTTSISPRGSRTDSSRSTTVCRSPLELPRKFWSRSSWRVSSGLRLTWSAVESAQSPS